MAEKKTSKEKKDPKISTNPKKMSSFFAWDGDTLILNILGTPGAKHDVIGKIKGNQLKISVTEAPRAGKATDYMVRFLAKEFDVATADIAVVFGRMNINKQLRIKAPKKLPSVIARLQ
ncbi:DUF167 domain-containing protein [Methylobacter psychrophilus]|uniref:DUF167 domain-containing protein n=1 Tax=Methylobacter psychrophilus TaxID=96941 RepID=UPI0021D4C76F|nr:DUF167 family protein [Methylobacter psychrophilus]